MYCAGAQQQLALPVSADVCLHVGPVFSPVNNENIVLKN